MNIEQVLSEARTFTDLRKIVEKTQPKVSFWGGYYVEVDGYEGSIPLDTLTEYVIAMIQSRPNFGDRENKDAMVLEDRINYFYTTSEVLVNDGNCLTYLFMCLRDLFDTIYCACQGRFTTRYRWDGPISWFP